MTIAPLHRPPQVSYHAAHAAIAAGLEECARIGMNCAIVVTDPSGEMVAVARTDGASGNTYRGALGKAKTAAVLGCATEEYLERRLLEDGKESARGALLQTLSHLAVELGSLDSIRSFLHVRGFVCATADFDKVHHVVGAASTLIGELFGDSALASRTAVGVATLPEHASVVLDAVVAVRGARDSTQ